MKKIVLILYTARNPSLTKPFFDLKYQACYEALYTLGETMGIHLCRAPLIWYNSGQNLFERAWEYVDGSWRITGPVKPDLIFDKTNNHSENDPVREQLIDRYPFIDDPNFTRFANNKYETSRLLPQYFKPYQKISSSTQWNLFLESFAGKKIVVKPIVGSGGKGVFIVEKAEAHNLELHFPVIVQEFIDGSNGIPGVIHGNHDLRLVFIGDEMIYSYIRTPRPGSLLANIAQGGSMTIVPREKLPLSLNPIIQDVQKLFSPFHQKTYTVDLMFDEHTRPWIIEFNTMPGMYFPPSEKITMVRVYTRLLQEIKKILTHFELTPRTPIHSQIPRKVNAVILFTPHSTADSRAFTQDKLEKAYTSFFALGEKHGLKLYRASTEWYDLSKKIFRQAWHWDGTKWAIAYHVIPDVIYDKATSNEKTSSVKQSLLKEFPLINHPDFSMHAGSKLSVSRAFKKYTKPYFLVQSKEELERSIKFIPGNTVVAKPDRGNSGDGVSIVTKQDLLDNPPVFPALIQEFVDSRLGIPGVMSGFHDLRLIFSNEELIYAYFRTPEAGSYLANVAKGGTQTMISSQSIPSSVWEIVEAVQKYYRKYPQKIYTIDLIFDQNSRPWIVELNTMPGLYPDESERPYIDKLYLAIIQALLNEAEKRS
jgi:glutathione synthase/RimK-type ligase-like ATP-grasp enzyme